MSIRNLLVITICLVLSLAFYPAAAQESPPDWLMMRHYVFEDRLLLIDANGVQTVPFPAFYHTYNESRPLQPRMVASANGEKIAFIYTPTATVDEAAIFFWDRTNDDCCTAMALPQPTVSEWGDAVFSPDGSRFVVFSEGTGEQIFVLSLVDTATGAVIQQLPTQHGDAVAAFRLRWTDHGISFHPTCWACEPPRQLPRARWDLETNTYQLDDDGVWLPPWATYWLGDHLAAYTAFDDRFAHSEEMDDYWGTYRNNVVLVSDMSKPGTSTVIYADPDNLTPVIMGWVMGGQGLLLGGNQQRLIVLRDGTQIDLSADRSIENVAFLGGTSAGFIGYQVESGVITHHVVSADGDVETETVGQWFANFVGADWPLIQHTMAVAPDLPWFVEVTP